VTGKTDLRDIQKKREASSYQPVAKDVLTIKPLDSMNCAISSYPNHALKMMKNEFLQLS
jgi:hypothetical protein